MKKIGRKPAGSHLTSTVMNTWNGRCSGSYRSLGDVFLQAFAQFSQRLRVFISIFLLYDNMAITFSAILFRQKEGWSGASG